MKLTVYLTESHTVTVKKKAIEIDTDEYPELKGLSKADIIKSIQIESEDLYCNDDIDSLYTKLINQEINEEFIDAFDYNVYVS